jgi:hypothetical protein
LEHNVANEITEITAGVGTVNPEYDPVGNMTEMPGDPGLSTNMSALTWDAWNRLVEVDDRIGSTSFFSFDGLNRRITEGLGGANFEVFHSAAAQKLEIREENSVTHQYIWGLQGANDLVRRLAFARPRCSRLLTEAIRSQPSVTKEPFSNVTATTPTASNTTMDANFDPAADADWNFLFQGMFRDFETHLYSTRARAYHPTMGILISSFGGYGCNRFLLGWDIFKAAIRLAFWSPPSYPTQNHCNVEGLQVDEILPTRVGEEAKLRPVNNFLGLPGRVQAFWHNQALGQRYASWRIFAQFSDEEP